MVLLISNPQAQNLPDLAPPPVVQWAYQELDSAGEAAAAQAQKEGFEPALTGRVFLGHNRRSVTESQKALCPYQDRLGILRLEAAHSHVAHQIKKTHFP